jgi:hypothetical protein
MLRIIKIGINLYIFGKQGEIKAQRSLSETLFALKLFSGEQKYN